MTTPIAIPLNGCDVFMLAMDDDIRRHGGCGNVCHLLVRLPSGTDLDPLRKAIGSHPTFTFVSSLRLATRFLRTPLWRPSLQATHEKPCATIPLKTSKEIESWILAHSINAKDEAPFGCLALPDLDGGPSLLFYWHHALCDAHGGEKVVSLISKAGGDPATNIIPAEIAAPPLSVALRRAHATKRRIYKLAQEPRTRCTTSKTHQPLRAYTKIAFSAAETAAIDELSRTATGGIFPTALYLAATARAFSDVQGSHDRAAPYFVPVPHDIRRLTRQRSPITNQISIAFFRIERKVTASLLDATNDIIGQLHNTVAGEHQQGILDFLRFVRWIPPRLLWKIIEHPTRGHPASFYFSDIGASLSALDSIHGVPVAYATHYPPLLSPPGFTTVWSRYRGNLEVTVCSDAATVGNEGVTEFEARLRDELLS